MSRENTIKKNTQEMKQMFLQALERNAGNIAASCEAIGIARNTYYAWRKKDKKFSEKCAEVEHKLIDMSETQLLKNIRDGKEASLFFFLVNRAPDRWKSINRVEITPGGETGKKIDIVLDGLAKILKSRQYGNQ